MTAPVAAAAPKHVERFADLLPDIRARLSALPDLEARVDCVVSFGGRLALDLGRGSLSLRQKAALQVLGSRQDFATDEGLFLSGRGGGLRLGMRSYGRLVLEQSPAYGPGDMDFGFLPLSDQELARMAEAEEALRGPYRLACLELESQLEELSPQELAQLLGTVKDMVDHIDPVLIYVDEATYTLFDRHNNLIKERNTGGPRHLFSALPGLAPAQWPHSDQVFTACMHLLKEAGLRGEEFNGRQLGPLELDAFLDAALERLSLALEAPLLERPKGLLAKARLHKELKEAARKDHLIVRWVQGLNFYKEERLLPKKDLPRRLEALDEALAGYFQDSAGLTWQRDESLDQIFSQWLVPALGGEARSRRPESLHPVEDMVHFLVEQAIAMVGADMGMSRSLRSYRKLAEVHDGRRHREACLWPITDYFCCAVPSPAMRQALSSRPGLLFTVLNAVAQRMNYNSWHYMPGHFPAEDQPAGRHYYYPPRMPDTAEWSNLHHAGHVLANVLYSIRSPGEVRYGGKDYWGFFDLRLMRQRGQPYSREDLKAAVAATGYLKAFYQALMDASAAGLGEMEVSAFDKNWYQKNYP